LTGGYNGEIREWTVPTLESDPEEPIVVLANDSRVLQSGLHTARIGMDLYVLLADVLFNVCRKENGLLKKQSFIFPRLTRF